LVIRHVLRDVCGGAIARYDIRSGEYVFEEEFA
jgi:hypothetical protein